MSKFDMALAFAIEKHAGQKRKGKSKEYILHPMEAAVIAARMTKDEDVLCAAVLHDVVEDTGVTVDELREKFGDRVAELVDSVSEDKMIGLDPEETWEERKRKALVALDEASRDTKLLKLADKLSNMREIAADYAVIGDKLWKRFRCKSKELYKWYYGTSLGILKKEFGYTSEISEYKRLFDRVFE